MNPSQIRLPNVEGRIQPGALPVPDHWEFLVFAKLLDQSVSSLAKQALMEWIAANRIELERRLQIAAASAAMQPEDLFCYLAQKESSLKDAIATSEATQSEREKDSEGMSMTELVRRLVTKNSIPPNEVPGLAHQVGVPVQDLIKMIETHGGVLNGVQH